MKQSITLIANSGIRFLKFGVEINRNDDITKALGYRDCQVPCSLLFLLPFCFSKRNVCPERYKFVSGKTYSGAFSSCDALISGKSFYYIYNIVHLYKKMIPHHIKIVREHGKVILLYIKTTPLHGKVILLYEKKTLLYEKVILLHKKMTLLHGKMVLHCEKTIVKLFALSGMSRNMKPQLLINKI
jgi:hypothetical protein